ncbi:MAG: hypothetical protein J3K34DRAFT_253040 [Monoraphidium minutum]|nr:MAG: hypothetical protein J3K34DRAFT_253040 [Monoraphidium minutum]
MRLRVAACGRVPPLGEGEARYPPDREILKLTMALSPQEGGRLLVTDMVRVICFGAARRGAAPRLVGASGVAPRVRAQAGRNQPASRIDALARRPRRPLAGGWTRCRRFSGGSGSRRGLSSGRTRPQASPRRSTRLTPHLRASWSAAAARRRRSRPRWRGSRRRPRWPAAARGWARGRPPRRRRRRWRSSATTCSASTGCGC